MPIIGTAGHVDHGKSTLVQALTGRDPDRWTEEKDRGLTIDLGFAWTRVADTAVGFVDVPGHERFIKNMLAGVGGFDVALFVVAADEGWMPQSEEHLAVMDLLGIRHGVIALTRIDLVDADLIELSTAEVVEHVAGTVAASWPIVEVSAPTNTGLDRVVAALGDQLRAAGPSPDVGRPKMWIDRVFSISGAGVVVTGTLIGGRLSVGDRLECFPGGEVRVRGLQSHETALDTVGPGTRVAANIVGADREDLERGTLLAAAGSIGTTRRFLAQLRTPPRPESEITDRGAYHVHLGTATIPVRIRVLEEDPATIAILTTRSPVPLTMGDRFVVRDTGRRLVAGGGIVLDPSPVRRPSHEDVMILSRAVASDPSDRADALVTVHGGIDAGTLDRSSGGGVPSSAILVGSPYVSPHAFTLQGRSLRPAVEDYHRRFPLRPGLPKSEAASRLGSDTNLILALIAGDPELSDDGPSIRLSGFVPRLGPSDEAAWDRARSVLAADLAVPRIDDLGLPDEVIHALIRQRELVRIADDLVLLPEQIDQVTGRLGSLPDDFTVAVFRDEYGLSRRHAVPLLEWLDAEGWTRRDGDGRTVRPSRGSSADDAPSR
jgi:selenocysteine-specific elongation factor